MPTYFLSGPDSPGRVLKIERRIREAIPDLARVASLEDIARDHADRPNQPIDVLVVAPPDDNGYFERLVNVASQYRDRVFFVMISEDISAPDYKRLVRTGGADWVSATGAPHEILDIIANRRVPRGSPAAPAGNEPVVVAFVPSAGGVGNATLVSEIGVWLKSNKATKGRRICVVDLDFQTSHICDHLDLEPHLQIQEIADNPERFDANLFDLFTTRHASGLDILAAPRRRLVMSDLKVAALDALFDMISTRYDLVLIDLPVLWFSWTSDVIANSDGVVITGVNTIPGLRQIVETLAAIRAARSAAGHVAVVVNRCEHRLMGGVARRQHVESVLVNEKVFYVRDDKEARVESINTGSPMALSNASRASMKQIVAVASYCAELKSIRSVGHESSGVKPATKVSHMQTKS